MSDRLCIECGRPAESPALPLCLDHDFQRLMQRVDAVSVFSRCAERRLCATCGRAACLETCPGPRAR